MPQRAGVRGIVAETERAQKVFVQVIEQRFARRLFCDARQEVIGRVGIHALLARRIGHGLREGKLRPVVRAVFVAVALEQNSLGKPRRVR